ncbi:MAG: hypothetical protein AB9834_02635 [Lentimicrobium sp.]
MKCVNCSYESENLKEYGFYVGNRAGYSNDTATYQMSTTPITDYVCPVCIAKARKKHLTKVIIFGSIALIFLILVFLFSYLNYEGWKVFFIVLASITCLPLLAFLVFYFEVADVGDQIVISNYLYHASQKGYDTYTTRSGYRSNKFYPIPLSRM